MKTKEFVINSPTLTSYKFWPGGIGVAATHGVVHAQTYVNGKHYGVQTFVVPIRDPATHKVYENLEVGELGPKLGLNGEDNGYMIFK